MKLENRIKELRSEKDNITQEELAKNIGVSRQTIISIEKGRFVPSTVLTLKIASFFKLPVESIFFLKETGGNEYDK